MLDWLVLWGVQGLGNFLFIEVLKPLAKGALEDYTTDFFKDCIADFTGLGDPQPLHQALGEALKVFLWLVQDELLTWGLSEAEVRDRYERPIQTFIHHPQVKPLLGRAFEPDCRTLDVAILEDTWAQLDAPPLPADFDWPRIAKLYLRQVKALMRESDKLRAILDSQRMEAIHHRLGEIAGIIEGIPADFNLEAYREGLLERYGNLQLESLDTTGCAYNQLRLWRLFVPQTVRLCHQFLPQVYEIPKTVQRQLQENGQLQADLSPDAIERYRKVYSEQLPRPILDVIKERDYAYLVVLGDPGSGKSTLLQYLATDWSQQPAAVRHARPLPLLIELRAYGRNRDEGRCSTFLEFLDRGNGIICHLNQQALHQYLKAGQAVALFDGLDEIFDPGRRQEVVADIHRFTNDYPQVRVIITSRVIGYKPQPLRDAGFAHALLQDLDSAQIEDFIQRWHEATFTQAADKQRKRERLQRAIRESAAIRELAGNPLLLTMMAILNRNQELPRDRAELYHQASRVLLHQWDVERAIFSDERIPRTIDYKDKQAMLRRVAYHMQASEKGLAANLIAAADLEEILTDYLKQIEVSEARDRARRIVEQLRSRNFILCSLGADYYAFVHRTFLEYFCAWEFVDRFEKQRTLPEAQLRAETFERHWREESWQEVLCLIVGMVGEEVAGRMIEYLLRQDEDKEYDKTFSNLLLAARCLADIRNRASIQTTATKLLQRLKQAAQIKGLPSKPSAKIVAAIATTWKDDAGTLPFLQRCLRFDQQSYVPESAVQEIVQGWRDDLETLPWLKQRAQQDENPYVRAAAVEELVQSWPDEPETLPWLKQLAQQGEHWVLRQVAVEELAQGWRNDPETLPILQQRAQQDEDGDVCQTAVRELARGWRDDIETLPWLKGRAQQDKDWAVRVAAVRELARGWRDDIETLPWLKERAQQDENWAVRATAVRELARGWRDDIETLPWLKGRAQQDENWVVRRTAVQELARGWRDDPEILLLLKTRVQQDEDGDVRATAVRELAWGWADDPQVLPWIKAQVQDEDEVVRAAAVEVLVRNFAADCDLFECLRDCAVSDPFQRQFSWQNNPRQVALAAIVQHYPERAETGVLLRQRAARDPDDQVRRFARESMGRLGIGDE